MKNLKCLCSGLVLLLAVPGLCLGANALIVHDGTPGIEADALTNLTTHLTGAGFTVTPNVGVPSGSLATYQQIWDIRFNNTTPLTGSDNAAYLTYLQGGGRLFLMGENLAFNTRNNSLLAFVAAAGGGTFPAGMLTPANTQTVQAPFTGPTALSTITYLAAGGVINPPGAPVTKDAGNLAAAVVFSGGGGTCATLASAPTGTLILVFDVNFMQTGADANSQTFLNNMISYLAMATPTCIAAPAAIPASIQIPTLSEWALVALAMLIALFGAGAVRRRFRMPAR